MSQAKLCPPLANLLVVAYFSCTAWTYIMTQGGRCDSLRSLNYFWPRSPRVLTFIHKRTFFFCALTVFIIRGPPARNALTFLFRVGLCPIVYGLLSFAREPYSFTGGLFLSGRFGFACGTFSTSQMDRFLLQQDLCLSHADLFVRAGLLSTICHPFSLLH